MLADWARGLSFSSAYWLIHALIFFTDIARALPPFLYRRFLRLFIHYTIYCVGLPFFRCNRDQLCKYFTFLLIYIYTPEILARFAMRFLSDDSPMITVYMPPSASYLPAEFRRRYDTLIFIDGEFLLPLLTSTARSFTLRFDTIQRL